MLLYVASLPASRTHRNADGETPLFLAALHGRKQAFLCLHTIRNPDTRDPPIYSNCRRNNGDTILHCAINDNHFDLAFQIIHLYKELAYWVNEEGLSSLHLLASKPSAFRSGIRLGWMETIAYHCIRVEKLKGENPAYDEGYSCPPNCNTLWLAFRLIRHAVVLVGAKSVDAAADEEDPGTGAGAKSVDAEADEEDPGAGGVDGAQTNSLFPANYKTSSDFIKFFYLLLLILLGKGPNVWKIYREKETHTWSFQVLKKLVRYASIFDVEDDGRKPPEDLQLDPAAYNLKKIELIDRYSGERRSKGRSLILMAAKEGVLELIEKVVESFPAAIYDMDEDKKNIVLLSVEHKQPHVYQFLLKKNIYQESLFRHVDKDGNSALHWAATLGDYKPWRISGEALQMQWELKWYEFVKTSMPAGFIRPYNNNHETPDEIFTKTHSKLVESGGEWLRRTSESCSVVAALVATVAFAAAATVPGGVDQGSGYPTLEKETSFKLFAATSLIALCCSVMAMVTFLSLLTSRFQEQNFHRDLPMKLLIGLTLLLLSIASMLVSFCAGHFFVLKHQLHHAGLALYAVTCLVVIFYVLAQFPLYYDYLRATFARVPQRS